MTPIYNSEYKPLAIWLTLLILFGDGCFAAMLSRKTTGRYQESYLPGHRKNTTKQLKPGSGEMIRFSNAAYAPEDFWFRA